jgi:hypothetical protein
MPLDLAVFIKHVEQKHVLDGGAGGAEIVGHSRLEIVRMCAQLEIVNWK